MRSWLNKILNTQGQLTTSKSSVLNSMDALVMFLKGRITSPENANNLLEITRSFFRKNESKKLKALPYIFLLYEQYLTEVEGKTKKDKLREQITTEYADLLGLPNFKLVFLSEQEQEIALAKKFIIIILDSVIKIVGEGQDGFFIILKSWMETVPSEESIKNFPFQNDSTIPYLSDNWLENLSNISNILLEKLEKKFGAGRTQAFYEKGYNDLGYVYRLLDTFPSIISLMPDRYLDAEKMNMLSKHQLGQVLLEKTQFLEQLNDELQAKNDELEQAQRQVIGSRLEAENALKQLTAVLNTMNEGIITADEEGIIVMINRKVEDIFGYTEQEVVGKKLTLLMPQKYTSSHESGMKRYMNTRMPRVLNKIIRIEGKRQDGSIFPLELNIAPTVIEQKMFFTAAVKDITEQLQMEEELIQSRNQLEIRVKERTKDLQIAQSELEATIAELERSNDELEQFAYVASHDLKEPLRMIGGYVNLIKRRYGKQIGEEADPYFAFALDGVKRMQRLITDLLDYSKVGSVATNFKVVEMSDILEVVKINLTTRIGEAKAQIIFENMPRLCVETSLIGQVFQNLIGNAIKFRKKEAAPIIKIQAKELENHWAFCIEDNGIGIPKAHLDTIFVIFKRANPHNYEGTGIGLAVVKKIVELHRGTIEVTSEVGKGSRFSFTIWKHFE